MSLRALIFTLIISAQVLLFPNSGQQRPRVLFLLSYEETFPTYADVRLALKTHPISQTTHFDIFYLDTKFSTDVEYLSLLRKFIYEKYLKRHTYNAILTYDDNALEIAGQLVSEHDIPTPVIFAGINNPELPQKIKLKKITGVYEDINLYGCICLMSALVKNLSTIYVITDETPTAKDDLERFYNTMQLFPDLGYKVITLQEFEFSNFYQYISSINDKRGTYLLLAAYRDKNKQYQPFYETLQKIVRVAQLPIFHPYKHGIGEGIAGGNVVNHYNHAQLAFDQLYTVITSSSDTIPAPIQNVPTEIMIDKAQVQKFNLVSDNIPYDATIIDSRISLTNINKATLRFLIFGIIVAGLVILITLIIIKSLAKRNRLLKAERELFQKLFMESPNPMFLINPNTFQIEEANLAAAQLYGYTIEEFRNMTIRDINKLSEKEIITIAENIAANKTKRFSLKHYTKSGELLYVDVHTTSIHLDGKQKIVSVITDQTQHRRMENELRNALAKSKEVEILITSFLRAMNHEVRTPLNGILGFTQLLISKTAQSDETLRYSNFILKCSDRLVEIIDDILDLSLIESGHIKINLTTFNLLDMVEELIEKFKPNIEEKSLVLHTQIPQNNSQILMYSDRRKVYKIINHLLSNAVKFTHEGMIEMKIILENKAVVITVTDTGIGIDPSLHTSILERFRQADMRTERRYEGLGIGLSIVKAFTEKLNGTFRFQSAPNTGSSFTITLPLQFSDSQIKMPAGQEFLNQKLN